MALRPSQRCRKKRPDDTEINIIPAMSLMVILIPFLLLTAVFGKASILNLHLPTEDEPTQAAPQDQPDVIIPTVAITPNGFILSWKKGAVLRIPKMADGDHDFNRLKTELIQIKNQYPSSNSMIILPEAKVPYQFLITTMDIGREMNDETGQKQPLFPVISLGEYRDLKNGI